MRGFRREGRLSSWRRMALHTWETPRDPSVYGTLEIDIGDARERIAAQRRETGQRITITHLVGRALALAIAERPEVNAIVRFGSLYRRDTTFDHRLLDGYQASKMAARFTELLEHPGQLLG